MPDLSVFSTKASDSAIHELPQGKIQKEARIKERGRSTLLH